MFVPSKMNYKLQITCWKKNQIISTSYERVIRILKNEKKNVKPVPVFRTGTGFHKNGEPVTGLYYQFRFRFQFGSDSFPVLVLTVLMLIPNITTSILTIFYFTSLMII